MLHQHLTCNFFPSLSLRRRRFGFYDQIPLFSFSFSSSASWLLLRYAVEILKVESLLCIYRSSAHFRVGDAETNVSIGRDHQIRLPHPRDAHAHRRVVQGQYLLCTTFNLYNCSISPERLAPLLTTKTFDHVLLVPNLITIMYAES